MINLDLLLKQNLHITKELIQSLKVLNMSKLELKKFLEKEKEENVMLDLEENFKNEKFISDLKDFDNKNIRNDAFDFNNINKGHFSIEEQLIFQLIEKSLSKDEERIIKYLIYSLDTNGYLDTSLQSVAEALNVSVSLVQSCQKLLTTFSPKGIGALDLRDCLLAQIQTNDLKLKFLVEKHLTNLSLNRYDYIMDDMDIGKDELLQLLEALERLNPHPTSLLNNNDFEKLIIPEIFVSFDDEKINIKVEKDNPIRINQHYLSLLETSIDKETKSYLRNKLARSLLIKSSIDKRNQTIEDIASYLINYQKDYFLKNLPLKPINQDDLAKNLHISASTVSRAVCEKYVETPNKIICLKDLFSLSTNSNAVSRDYIIKMIYLLIREEDKANPLSDDEISKKLLNMDIKIKRRTVQKYRNLLNEPSSYKRKRIYDFKAL